MPVWSPKKLMVSAEDLLRAQAIDPHIEPVRLASLTETARQAIAKGTAFIAPVVLYREFPVAALEPDGLILHGGGTLSGPLIVHQLGAAQAILVLLCSLGPDLDSAISDNAEQDPLMAMGLESLGSAAVERLSRLACQHFGEQARKAGLSTGAPLSPGMVGWPVSIGQPEIFNLLDGQEIGLSLTETQMMIPRKSLSMVIGIGTHLPPAGEPCEHCSMHGSCRQRGAREG